jgi:steroid delta-isomerase-like uncharacterized protein
MTNASADAAAARRLETVRTHIRLENRHDLDAVMDTFGTAARYDDEPWDEHYDGRDGVRSFYEQLFRALPDVEIDVRGEHSSLDAVVVECVIRGTHRGAWRGLPATGRRIALPLCGVYTFGPDDALAGERIYYDRATLLRQLGVFREPTSIAGRLLLLLNHPIRIARALLGGGR